MQEFQRVGGGFREFGVISCENRGEFGLFGGVFGFFCEFRAIAELVLAEELRVEFFLVGRCFCGTCRVVGKEGRMGEKEKGE